MLKNIDVPPSRQRATEKAAALFRACVRLGSDSSHSEGHQLKRFLSRLGFDFSDMSYDPNFDILDRIASLSFEFGIPAFVKIRLFRSPPKFFDYTLEVTPFPDIGDEFFTPYITSLRQVTIRIFRGHVDARFTPAQANAFYFYEVNEIRIHAGIVQPPVYFQEAPAALNYGALGQIAAHEMMHAFDIWGIAHDERLRPVNFKMTNTMKRYEEKVLCLRASYQEAENASRARTTDAKTDSEGFADFTGLLLAHSALQSLSRWDREAALPGVRLTAKQLFYVAHCRKWCAPPSGPHRRDPKSSYWAARSRCIVPLQNMPQFAADFQCRPGDYMNPRDRCSFW
ncbi:hypothetical protein V5799_002631 [Amblyomma americanum]|uniref:Peptidase M13 C-terminal domain-containing protein n=1 Tax=Amblyomma americanum TaxID=6943 RepID=A0AAQ4DB99_AMBAM